MNIESLLAENLQKPYAVLVNNINNYKLYSTSYSPFWFY